MTSKFLEIQQVPPVEIFELISSFTKDSCERKVNLSVGAYLTDDGMPWVLPVVKNVEKEMAAAETTIHEYLPILGLDSFTSAATRLLLKDDCKALQEGQAFGVQTVAGTGGLRIVADFLCKVLKYSTYYYSNPYWGNHPAIFQNAGFTEGKQYRYCTEKAFEFDFEGMIEDLKNASANSVIILQSCAHNPTGVDPSKEQWEKIGDVIKEKNMFPVFDAAYQGFASGDPDNDAWAVRHFVNRGFELIAAQSFSKNFGLYGERVGNMVIVVKDVSVIRPIQSNLAQRIRSFHNSSPNHGARIVSRVLNDPVLFAEWKVCIQIMSDRIKAMRAGLRERLEKLGTPGTWDHITKQIGMFSYTGLTAAQVVHLVNKHHIYLPSSGRINMCGINTKNIDYVAKCIDDAVRNVSG